MNCRPLAFIVGGGAGFLVQLALLAALTHGLRWSTVSATALAVEAAVLTNFFWHERWTWRDRAGTGGGLSRLWRYQATNGATSLIGNVIVTAACVELVGVPPVAANLLAVVLLSAVNYAVADRWVFRVRDAQIRIGLFAGVALLMLSSSSARGADLKPETRVAWDRYVAAVEQSLPDHECDPPLSVPEGRSIEVSGGSIHEWRGSVTVPHTTVKQIVDALLNLESLPLPEDVTESRVLARRGDSLHTYLKLTRSLLVSVTYDTEHDVQYSRRSPSFATSRSVATKIVEVGGGDRGFLWRLHSYWRYRQVGNTVQVDVLSLSLSRGIPWGVGAIARPVIDRIGRESMGKTLAWVSALCPEKFDSSTVLKMSKHISAPTFWYGEPLAPFAFILSAARIGAKIAHR